MAITQTLVRRTVFGDRKVRYYDVTFDNAYVANGWPLSLSDFPSAQIENAIFTDCAGFTLTYDFTNNTIRAFLPATNQTTAGAEFSTGANALNTKVVRVMLIGY